MSEDEQSEQSQESEESESESESEDEGKILFYYWTVEDGLFINSYFRNYCVVYLCEGVESLCTSCVHKFCNVYILSYAHTIYTTTQHTLKTLKHR